MGCRGFDPDSEKGPSVQDQRHRFVASGIYMLPHEVELSAIVAMESGRPYNILAGVDLNGDGDGGATDRAGATLSDIGTSIYRNAGAADAGERRSQGVAAISGGWHHLDGILEVFNLFNRSNFIAVNNVFGTGSYPSAPTQTFGQFTQAAPPDRCSSR